MKTLTQQSLQALMLSASAAFAILGTGTVKAATPYVGATVSGELQPGIYGRIDIGNSPPPPLVYAQPVIIQRPAVYVRQEPLYLHVPPGHAKKWSKHCSRYNACGQPVYFVRVNGDEDYERRGYENKQRGNGKDKDKQKYREDKGNGKHKGHDRD
jgi:hypothetical protein